MPICGSGGFGSKWILVIVSVVPATRGRGVWVFTIMTYLSMVCVIVIGPEQGNLGFSTDFVARYGDRLH